MLLDAFKTNGSSPPERVPDFQLIRQLADGNTRQCAHSYHLRPVSNGGDPTNFTTLCSRKLSACFRRARSSTPPRLKITSRGIPRSTRNFAASRRASTRFSLARRPEKRTRSGRMSLLPSATDVARSIISSVIIDVKKGITWAGSSGRWPWTVTGPRHHRGRNTCRYRRSANRSP
jgi:hypothetical protein